MADLKLKNIEKKFDEIEALKKINIEIKDGEFFVLLGPTGAGKTTMLRIVAGLEKQDEGNVIFNDKCVDELSPAERDIAFVFQYYTLYPHLTVRQNLEFPLKSKQRKYSKEEVNNRIEYASKAVRVEHLLDRETSHLSGGEMQRVGIGRAIVRKPKIFLMDEPLSNLDAKLREDMRSELKKLQLELVQTFFYVTHDQVEALTMANRIAVLNEGKIHQIDTPEEIYNNPADTFVAKFIGSPQINLIESAYIDGKLKFVGVDNLLFELTGEQKEKLEKGKEKKFIYGIRPEDIHVYEEKTDEENLFECEIYFNQSMGAEDILNLKIGEQIFRAVIPPGLNLKIGQKVYAKLSMENSHLFDYENELRIV